MPSDWYSVLGITTSANQEEIKKAYRQKAFQYHPDRNPDNPQAESTFKEIAEAYRILGNEELRKAYDRRSQVSDYLSNKFSASRAAATAAEVVNDIIDDSLFERLDKLFKSGTRPQDIELEVRLTLEEFFCGTDKDVSFKKNEPCLDCKGRGAIKREDFKICHSCLGSGWDPTNIVSLITKKECKKCRGSGKIISKKCAGCKGKGLVKKDVTLTIPIPNDLDILQVNKGLEKLIVPNEGEHGGNLVVSVTLKSHKFFEVQGYDILVSVPVQFYQAILGDYLEIDTLKGSAYFKLPPGSQTGDEIVLSGYGLRKSENSYGDMIIQITVETISSLTPEQRTLLEQIQRMDKTKGKNKPKRRFES